MISKTASSLLSTHLFQKSSYRIELNTIVIKRRQQDSNLRTGVKSGQLLSRQPLSSTQAYLHKVEQLSAVFHHDPVRFLLKVFRSFTVFHIS